MWTDHKAFYGLPGYAYCLALIYKGIGYQPFVVSFIQQVLEACTATLLFRLAPVVFVRPGERTTRGAGGSSGRWRRRAGRFACPRRRTRWC